MDVQGRDSKVKTGKNRRVVTGFLPTARIADDVAGVPGLRDIRCGPDMIQPATLVGGIPIGGAVGPPAIEIALRHILPRDVDPIARILHRTKRFDLDRGVADDL